MKNGKKLAFLLGTAGMALTGCKYITNNRYQKIVKPLEDKITADVAKVENFAYFKIYKEIDTVAFPIEYTYVQNNDNYFVNITCYHKKYKNDSVTPCDVQYSLSFDDFDTIRNTEKSYDDSYQNSNIVYTGDVEVLQNVLSHETSKLHSVGNYYTVNNQLTEENTL